MIRIVPSATYWDLTFQLPIPYQLLLLVLHLQYLFYVSESLIILIII